MARSSSLTGEAGETSRILDPGFSARGFRAALIATDGIMLAFSMPARLRGCKAGPCDDMR